MINLENIPLILSSKFYLESQEFAKNCIDGIANDLELSVKDYNRYSNHILANYLETKICNSGYCSVSACPMKSTEANYGNSNRTNIKNTLSNVKKMCKKCDKKDICNGGTLSFLCNSCDFMSYLLGKEKFSIVEFVLLANHLQTFYLKEEDFYHLAELFFGFKNSFDELQKIWNVAYSFPPKRACIAFGCKKQGGDGIINK